MRNFSPLAGLLAFALLVAVICNGAGFYLKRTGVIATEDFRAYWSIYCAAIAGLPSERPCHLYTTPAEIANAVPRVAEPIASTYRYVYEIRGGERWLKLLKDFFWSMLLGVSAWLIVSRQAPIASWRQAWPIYLLSACCLASLVVSVELNGAWIALAGARSFAFLAAALLCTWLAPYLPLWATAVAGLLVLQASLLPFELVRGVHLFREWSAWSLASRVAGTLSQPNSMGVFAAAGLAFVVSFWPAKDWRLWILCGLSAAIVLLAGSGTGIVCVLLATWFAVRRRAGPPQHWLVAAGIGLAAMAVALLPELTGREDIFHSLLSGPRIEKLQEALFGRTVPAILFGSGLGVDTNLALNLASFDIGAASKSAGRNTDSALASLLMQVGVFGASMFYMLLVWAALRDAGARPFYAVVALCSLTINLGELFPVNVLIGVALANSAARNGPSLNRDWPRGRAGSSS